MKLRIVKNLSKKSCKTISVICFACAVLSVCVSTIRLQQIEEVNQGNIDYGMRFLTKNALGTLNIGDVAGAAVVLDEMKANNKKTDFYTWFRIIGSIVFVAGGVFFAVNAQKEDNTISPAAPKQECNSVPETQVDEQKH